MTVRADVRRTLEQAPQGMTDAQLAAALGKNSPHINLVCRQLEQEGQLRRDRGTGQIVNVLMPSVAKRVLPAGEPPAESSPREWFGEVEVQAAVVRHLAATGWAITRVADTATREHGVDVIADRPGRRLLVEVKGWPSTLYARGPKAGEEKPTHPSTQAKVWYADGLLAVLRLREREPDVEIALALPSQDRYRNLISETRSALQAARVTVLLVTGTGQVSTYDAVPTAVPAGPSTAAEPKPRWWSRVR